MLEIWGKEVYRSVDESFMHISSADRCVVRLSMYGIKRMQWRGVADNNTAPGSTICRLSPEWEQRQQSK
jgi:hypothetical protein